MKRFNKYFGGIYMKYWYVAFAVVVAIMLLNFYNNKSVFMYKLTIFDKNGVVKEEKEINKNNLGIVEIIKNPKAVVPIKKF